jgi:hypothetical protein
MGREACWDGWMGPTDAVDGRPGGAGLGFGGRAGRARARGLNVELGACWTAKRAGGAWQESSSNSRLAGGWTTTGRKRACVRSPAAASCLVGRRSWRAEKKRDLMKETGRPAGPALSPSLLDMDHPPMPSHVIRTAERPRCADVKSRSDPVDRGRTTKGTCLSSSAGTGDHFLDRLRRQSACETERRSVSAEGKEQTRAAAETPPRPVGRSGHPSGRDYRPTGHTSPEARSAWTESERAKGCGLQPALQTSAGWPCKHAREGRQGSKGRETSAAVPARLGGRVPGPSCSPRTHETCSLFRHRRPEGLVRSLSCPSSLALRRAFVRGTGGFPHRRRPPPSRALLWLFMDSIALPHRSNGRWLRTPVPAVQRTNPQPW